MRWFHLLIIVFRATTSHNCSWTLWSAVLRSKIVGSPTMWGTQDIVGWFTNTINSFVISSVNHRFVASSTVNEQLAATRHKSANQIPRRHIPIFCWLNSHFSRVFPFRFSRGLLARRSQPSYLGTELYK